MTQRSARLGRLEINYLRLAPLRLGSAAVARHRLVVYPLPLEEPDEVARFLEHHVKVVRG